PRPGWSQSWDGGGSWSSAVSS
ncbi:hypothetical protein PSD17_41930, partial [Pseudonocardia sp. D17]